MKMLLSWLCTEKIFGQRFAMIYLNSGRPGEGS